MIVELWIAQQAELLEEESQSIGRSRSVGVRKRVGGLDQAIESVSPISRSMACGKPV